jgi:hypothetical protein
MNGDGDLVLALVLLGLALVFGIIGWVVFP